MVTVERLVALEKPGALRGFASVDIAGKLKIHDLRIVQQEGKRAFVSMPQCSYEKDGKRRYYPIIELPDHVQKAIEEAVLAAWGTR